MSDVRPRDLYRVWHKVIGNDREYAAFFYATDPEQAMEIASRRLPREWDKAIEVIRAEKR